MSKEPAKSSEFLNMKKSSEWVRQSELDKKLDQLVEEAGITPAELNIYEAAKALGLDAGGEFYKKVRDWKQRRAAESDQPMIEVPPGVQAEFRDVVDRFSREVMDNFLRAVRAIGGDFDRAAALRVAEAERRRDEAQSELGGLIDRWVEAEAERDAALEQLVQLKQMLAEATRREEILAARLEESHAMVRALVSDSGEEPEAVNSPQAWNENAVAGNAPLGTSGRIDPDTPGTEAPAPEKAHPIAGEFVEAQRQSKTESEYQRDGQAEMPFGTHENAAEADRSGGDSG